MEYFSFTVISLSTTVQKWCDYWYPLYIGHLGYLSKFLKPSSRKVLARGSSTFRQQPDGLFSLLEKLLRQLYSHSALLHLGESDLKEKLGHSQQGSTNRDGRSIKTKRKEKPQCSTSSLGELHPLGEPGDLNASPLYFIAFDYDVIV